MAPKKTTKNYTFAVGRRRTSIARVRLFKGRGESLVNGKPIAEYFASIVGGREIWSKPFELTDTASKFWATVKVVGGGKVSQLTSTVHGISRTLAGVDPEFRSKLKKDGLLTRDPRTRERRKVGMGGKSRRKRQSPKR